MSSLHQAAQRRNDYAQPADQTLRLENWSRPTFPAADLVERITHRPPETCRIIAALAGYREMEAQ